MSVSITVTFHFFASCCPFPQLITLSISFLVVFFAHLMNLMKIFREHFIKCTQIQFCNNIIYLIWSWNIFREMLMTSVVFLFMIFSTLLLKSLPFRSARWKWLYFYDVHKAQQTSPNLFMHHKLFYQLPVLRTIWSFEFR